MKFSDIAQAIGARWHGTDGVFLQLTTDSRQVKPGDCFVAIKGAHHDGHDFVAQAISQGARAVMVSRQNMSIPEEEICVLTVGDTVKALGRWAAYWREQFSIPVIGITGSCGKTSVKGMIASICEIEGKTLATQGNYNNEIGLPLTLLGLGEAYRYAVIEMGASAKGDIAYLAGVAKPTVSLITNVAPAHLQGFGSLPGVAHAKGEIYAALPDTGIAVVNQEEPLKELWQTAIGPRRTLTFGLSSDAMVFASAIEACATGVVFTLHVMGETRRVKMNIPGKHTVLNALASAAAAHAVGIGIESIVEGLARFKGVPGRLSYYAGWGGASVMDDTYNANPGSMEAALAVLAQQTGRTIFVMGDMAELGEAAADYHASIGLDARKKGILQLLAVGQWSMHAVEAFGAGATWYVSQEALIQALREQMTAETVVLVKGSRSARMEMITQAIIVERNK